MLTRLRLSNLLTWASSSKDIDQENLWACWSLSQMIEGIGTPLLGKEQSFHCYQGSKFTGVRCCQFLLETHSASLVHILRWFARLATSCLQSSETAKFHQWPSCIDSTCKSAKWAQASRRGHWYFAKAEGPFDSKDSKGSMPVRFLGTFGCHWRLFFGCISWRSWTAICYRRLKWGLSFDQRLFASEGCCALNQLDRIDSRNSSSSNSYLW
jgi:hypothetical protein